MNRVEVSQAHLMKHVLPLLKRDGSVYRKYRSVMARPAVVGEVVVSTTAAGPETVNTAGEGDYVVQNFTAARELYIVRGKTFHERYELEDSLDNWSRCRPIGQVIGLEVRDALLVRMGLPSPFYIEASWKQLQVTAVGDFLVCPLDGREIYRIARQEFGETYAVAMPDR